MRHASPLARPLWHLTALLLVAALGWHGCGSDGGGRTTGPTGSGSSQISVKLRGVRGVTAALEGVPAGCSLQITVTPPGKTVTIEGSGQSITVPAGVPVEIFGKLTCGAEEFTASETATFAPGQSGQVTLVFGCVLPVVSVAVSGPGQVSGPGIACPGDCSQSFPFGAQASLQATPAPGQIFAGWSGACSGTGACNLNMSTDRSVTAVFGASNRSLAVSVTGNGQVTGPGITCPGDCGELYPLNTAVNLTAVPGAGQKFDGWGGDCSGTGACSVNLSQNRSVTAAFSAAAGAIQVNNTADPETCCGLDISFTGPATVPEFDVDAGSSVTRGGLPAGNYTASWCGGGSFPVTVTAGQTTVLNLDGGNCG
jgi:hypothetical protein